MSDDKDMHEYRATGTPRECDGSDRFMHTKGDGSWWEKDARGIPLKRVCDRCIKAKLAGYRPEVLTDSNYEANERIDPEDP